MDKSNWIRFGQNQNLTVMPPLLPFNKFVWVWLC